MARIRKLPAGPINALECDQWSRLTTLMPARPWNAPTEPPDGHTSSLASNHVRHRPHLQARRAHRAQGLGTRPIRIIPEPRHRPARVPGNARSGVGLEHRCQTPARLATARGRAARRTRETRENGRSPRRIRYPSSRVGGGDPSGPSGRARALHRPERVGYLSASDTRKAPNSLLQTLADARPHSFPRINDRLSRPRPTPVSPSPRARPSTPMPAARR